MPPLEPPLEPPPLLGPMLEPRLPEDDPIPRSPDELEPRSPLELLKPLPPLLGVEELLAPMLLSWNPGLKDPPLLLLLPPPKILLRVLASSTASTFCKR